MCGFAGVVAFHDKYRTSDETLRRMSAAIAHRGPDGEGYYVNHNEEITPERPQVALAFRRLAILDPDPRSNQPFTDGRHWLVFNGEIYTVRELRAELTSIDPSYQWRTTGDTEVLLRSYAVWREKCVSHLNGMFALAVWDEQEKTLFLARDRMGQKPLYFAPLRADRSGQFHAAAFASELSALRALPWVDQMLHPPALHEYLLCGYVPESMTIYVGVEKLRPGHWMHLSSSLEESRRYFNAGGHFYFDPLDLRDITPPQRTRLLLERAVKRQLVSDVSLGALLSGGIDSSVVAAAMKRSVEPGQAVKTFSIGFDDQRYDETAYARDVAVHLGTEHHEFIVRPQAAEDLPRLARVFGEPFGDSSALPTHYLARETRRHVKVALSGDGGDELFGGYDRYRALLAAERVRKLPLAGAALAGARLLQALPGTHPKSRLARLKRFAASMHLPPGPRYASYLRLFDLDSLNALYGGRFVVRSDPQIIADEWFETYTAERALVPAAMALDRVTYLPGDLLTKVDRASMLHALEVRSPFMDHELVQFAAGLTTNQLLKGGPKRMLREAFADDLPGFVFKRRKMGFAVPIGEWFRGELRAMLRDHLFAGDSFARGHFNLPVVERLVEEHEQQRVDHSQRLYALLMLELWWRQAQE